MAERPPRRISQSEVRTFKTCRRQWYLGWIEGYTMRPEHRAATGVAQLGTNVHTALEAYYGYDLDPLAVLAWIYNGLRADRPEAEKDLNSEQSYASTMVEGYLQWASENGTDQEFEVIGTERLMSVPMVVEYPYQDGLIESTAVVLTGRIDQTIRQRDGSGRAYIRDWKTVGDLSKADALQRDEQMRWYDLLYWLASQADDDVQLMSGVYYTMLKRSKRTMRARPPFYDAVFIHYTAADRRSMLLRTRRVLGELLLIEDELRNGADHLAVAYPHPEETGHCRYCPFKEVCALADDGSRFDDALNGVYVKADPYAYQSNDAITKVRHALGSG
jgi:CRISPR/Cas system-associated exonuclease Cas4 (RecB family)